MNHLKQSLGVDDTYTKLYRWTNRPEEQTRVKDNIPLVPDYNQMADMLHLPTDAFGFCKLLVVVDIATDYLILKKWRGNSR